MTKTAAVTCIAAVIVLVSAPSAQAAGELTRKQASKAVQPVAAQLVGTVGPAIAAKLPGATVLGSRVARCRLANRRRRADCVISFAVRAPQTGDTECALDALVRRNRSTRKLEVSVGRTVLCIFPVELP
jgi:hypothetical protein